MTQLLPFSPIEMLGIATSMCNFFSPMGEHRQGEIQSLPAGQGIRPLQMLDYFKWIKDHNGFDPFLRMERTLEIAAILERAGILVGYDGAYLKKRYLFTKQLTQRQRLGKLWLASALGTEVIAHQLAHNLVRLVGINAKGDQRTGSGVLFDEHNVLTCAHNLTDMTLGPEAFVAEQRCKIENSRVINEKLDVGLVRLTEPQNFSKDIALRDATLLEPVLVCGFPPVPRSLKPVLTFHNGEVNGFASQTLDGSPALLLSAITRPGNSGGPVVSRDGRIVGIVTRDLARQAEAGELAAPFPFFTALPSSSIRDVCSAVGIALPWEDFA